VSQAPTTSPRVARRRRQARREILDAAADLARRDGLANLSLRALATKVGLTAPSLYGYFASKDAIYDALFAEGYEELNRRMTDLPATGDARQDLAAGLRAFLAFCLEDVARYQLLFTAAVPGWHPSRDAYAVSQAQMTWVVDRLASLGIDDAAAVDLWTALASGLAAQQMANDPHGDRWVRLVEPAVEMYLRQVADR
jgi:AcrR family transcriptional regulator